MIRTHVFEIVVDIAGKITEQELGWCLLPEVPMAKEPPQPEDKAQVPRMIKIDGERFGLIGHSWELDVKKVADEVGTTNFESATAEAALPDAVMVLFVQRVTAASASGPKLVRAPAHALKEVELQMPPPGKRAN